MLLDQKYSNLGVREEVWDDRCSGNLLTGPRLAINGEE
jgi:hypothetical protein